MAVMIFVNNEMISSRCFLDHLAAFYTWHWFEKGGGGGIFFSSDFGINFLDLEHFLLMYLWAENNSNLFFVAAVIIGLLSQLFA